MKKSNGWVWALMLVVGLTVAGCGGGGKEGSVDTSAMEKSMSTADPESKGDADKAVSAIKSGDYSGAMSSLNNLAAQAKLTPEQKAAVEDVISQVKKQMEAAAEKVAEEGKEMMEDGKKALEGVLPK